MRNPEKLRPRPGLCIVLLSLPLWACTEPEEPVVRFSSPPVRLPAATPPPNSHREGLTPSVPPGWGRVHWQAAAGQFIAEYVPAGQTTTRWREMITYQGFPQQDAPTFMHRFQQLAKSACKSSLWAPLPQERQNGYTAQLAFMFCGSNPDSGLGEITHIKAVRGSQGLWVAQYARRTAPFDPHTGINPLSKRQSLAMIQALANSRVCVEGDPAHRCPPNAEPIFRR